MDRRIVVAIAACAGAAAAWALSAMWVRGGSPDITNLRWQARIATVYKLVRSMLRKMPGMTTFGGRVLPGAQHIAVRWLADACVRAGALSSEEAAALRTVTITPLSDNRGLAGDVRCVLLEFDNANDASSSKASTRLILKTSRCADADFASAYAQCARDISSGQWREARLYADAMVGDAMHVPRVVHAWWSAWTGEYVCLMENVGASVDEGECVGVNMFLGNQIWGAPTLARPRTPTQVLEDAFTAAADLHAKFWRQSGLLAHSHLKYVPWMRGAQRGRWEASLETAKKAWTTVLEKRAVPDTVYAKMQWNSAFVDVVSASLAGSSWDALQRHVQDPRTPFTLTHGDFHASNMLWRYRTAHAEAPADSSGSLFLIDWSEVGVWEPTADLGQMMISDVRPDVRRACEKAALRTYWHRLCQRGVSETDYPFAQCWDEYRRAGLERWLWILPVLLSFPMPVAALQYFHDQVCAFWQDHGEGCKQYALKALVIMPGSALDL